MKPKKGKKKSTSQAGSVTKVKKRSSPFAIGEEVLACWQDGLYYLAIVKSVDEVKAKCYVSFQDGSLYWISFKNIRTTPESDEITCAVCSGKESKRHNEIIICDRCNHGYHQDCHTPVVDDQCIAQQGEWFCRICVFSKAAESGGALKSGPEADALMTMKLTLPYDVSSLKWDVHHKTNLSETYCYCGGPGLWYYKMIECYNCKQWFHEACLQCLDFPLLLGDRFYYFLCVLCNDERKEYLKRIQLRWPDIAQLVVYNMSLKYDKKYFTLKEIKSFVNENWDALQTRNLHNTTEEERMAKINEVFKNQRKKYRSHCDHGVVMWSIIVRTAPCPSKPSSLREHTLKTQTNLDGELFDINGNDLSKVDNSCFKGSRSANSLSQEQVSTRGRPGADTSTEAGDFQCPLFPSLTMFKYLLPSSARRSLETGGTAYPALSSAFHLGRSDSDECPRVGEKRSRTAISDVHEPIEKGFIDYVQRLSNDITSYEGSRGRLACGEDCAVRGRRLGKSGRVEYLVEWSGTAPNGC